MKINGNNQIHRQFITHTLIQTYIKTQYNVKNIAYTLYLHWRMYKILKHKLTLKFKDQENFKTRLVNYILRSNQHFKGRFLFFFPQKAFHCLVTNC